MLTHQQPDEMAIYKNISYRRVYIHSPHCGSKHFFYQKPPYVERGILAKSFLLLITYCDWRIYHGFIGRVVPLSCLSNAWKATPNGIFIVQSLLSMLLFYPFQIENGKIPGGVVRPHPGYTDGFTDGKINFLLYDDCLFFVLQRKFNSMGSTKLGKMHKLGITHVSYGKLKSLLRLLPLLSTVYKRYNSIVGRQSRILFSVTQN